MSAFPTAAVSSKSCDPSATRVPLCGGTSHPSGGSSTGRTVRLLMQGREVRREERRTRGILCRKFEMCLIIYLPKQAGFSHNHVTFVLQYYNYFNPNIIRLRGGLIMQSDYVIRLFINN